jgi:signal transduction histidine kinase
MRRARNGTQYGLSMRDVVRRVVLYRDWIVAGVLLVVGLVEIWVTTLFQPGYPGPRSLQTVALIALSLAVARRRTSPLGALGLVLGATTVQWVYARGQGQLPAGTFLIVMLIPFTVGAWAPRLRGGLAAAAVAIIWIVQDVVDAFSKLGTVRTDFGYYVLYTLAWLAGATVSELRLRATQLEDLTEELHRERDLAARTAVLEERTRIAREMHDIVAHSVSLMVVQTGGARQVIDAEPETARATLLSAEDTGRQALGELRRLLGILRRSGDTELVDPRPGTADIGDLVTEMGEAGLTVRFSVEGASRDLPAGTDLTTFRVVQEALTNVMKHASVSEAHVTLRYGSSDLEIEVTDDGLGASPPSNGYGHGLIGMRERVELYGGSLRTGPRTEGGYRVFAHIPIEAP